MEYKNLKQFKQLTGKEHLTPFDWYKSDRINNTKLWQQVCKLNFTTKGKHTEYKTISERRDFYKWAYQTLKKQGHEIKTPALAYIVTSLYSKTDNKFNKIFAPKWFLTFANEGTAIVMADLIPKLYEVLKLEQVLVGEEAEKWDKEYLYHEQCNVLDPLFHSLTAKQLKKMRRISKGKGVYNLFVENELKYNQPSLINCEDRVKYGLEVIMPYAEKELE